MRGRRRYILLLPVAAILAAAVASCTIEPPLNLAGREDVDVRFGEVVIDLDVIWDIEGDWREGWWYGWDDDDVRLWGKIEYPLPPGYEVRLYFLGRNSPTDPYLSLSAHHTTEARFRRRLDYGFHNVLAWSDIATLDGTQVVVIDETDPLNIYATTSRISTGGMASSSSSIHNNPEIFYSGYEQGFEITDDPADYDYFLEEEGAWVKLLHTSLYPRVYIYLVQVVVYNNNGRIIGATQDCDVTGLAAAVQLHTGRTSVNAVPVAFEMRLKRGLSARAGRVADILGGKLTTFGLCDMVGWDRSRSTDYGGSRTDLANNLEVGLRFANDTDSIFSFDITDQMRRQVHGGIITIELDADTIPVPSRPGGGRPTGGFDPTISPVDSIEYLFPM